MLQVKKHAPTASVVFIWGFAFESFQEVGIVSINPLTQNNSTLLHSLSKLNVFCGIGNVKWKFRNNSIVLESKE